MTDYILVPDKSQLAVFHDLRDVIGRRDQEPPYADVLVLESFTIFERKL